MAYQIGPRNGTIACGWEESFAVAKDIGFDCIELDVPGDYQTQLIYSADGRETLRKLSGETGVAIASICLGTYWSIAPGSPDEAVRAEALQVLLDTIDACAEMNIPAILAPLTENDSTKPEPVDVQKDRWAELLKAAGARGDEKGVKIGLEGCARAYAKTAEDVIELADRSGADCVGAYYDPANAMAAGLDPVAEIKMFGPRLKAFHVKDTKGNHLGEGQVDFDGVVAAVKENGYSGALILETPGKDDPIASGKLNLEYTQKAFNG